MHPSLLSADAGIAGITDGPIITITRDPYRMYGTVGRHPQLPHLLQTHWLCAPLARNQAFSINVCPSCTKPYFSKKCVPLLHETTLFAINGGPSCTKPHFFKKCVPLLHETTLFREMCAPLARNHTFLQKHRNPHAWIREQLSKSAHLPDPTHAGTKYPRSGEPLTLTDNTLTQNQCEGDPTQNVGFVQGGKQLQFETCCYCL